MTTATSTNGTSAIGKQITQVIVPDIKPSILTLTVIGDSPLIMHAWSEKAKKEMLGKQMGEPKTGKQPKNPEQDYLDSMYKDSDGDYAFPAVAFKAAAVSAGLLADLKMAQLRRCFHVRGDLVKI